MREDSMSRTRNDIMLRAACGRVESWRIESGLVLRLQAVTTAEDKVVLAKYDIDRSCEEWRRCDDGAEREELAECLSLLIRDPNGKV